MKKTTYLIALFFTICASTYAQYTAIPDAAFEQALINDGIDTAPIDGQILTADAIAYASDLNIDNEGITDLTGIEAFVNITGLDISYNAGIPSVDLTNSPLLTNINATECTALTSMDVTGLTALTEILAAKAGLTALDLSTNTALETLNARKCSLTSLDLSANTAITYVHVKNNSLTFFDMRNGNNANVTFFDSGYNPALQCLYVDDTTEPNISSWIIDGNTTFVETIADCNALSVEQVSVVSFNMYPNPVKGTLYVTAKTNNAVVSIYNITGKEILTKPLIQGENVVNVSNLASGIYLARFVSDNKVDTKKLIIK